MRKRTKVFGGILLFISICMAAFLGTLPNEIGLVKGQDITLQLPFIFGVRAQDDAVTVQRQTDERLGSDGIVLTPKQVGNTQMDLTVFGLTVGHVKAEVTGERRLHPGGQSIGVALHTKGVLIVGTSAIGGSSPAQDAGLRPGDIISKVDGEEVTTSRALGKKVADSSDALKLEIVRDGLVKHVSLMPKIDERTGSKRIGAWVRDSTAGVGTMTFSDPELSLYGALGHVIADIDTGDDLTVGTGEIRGADILDIQQGKSGTPGELKGSISKGPVQGDIVLNTPFGIYGKLNDEMNNPLYPDGLLVGGRESVHVGDASILSTIGSEGIRQYACRIVKVTRQDKKAQKSFIIKITDEELLSRTGGIVQGMSGSPILQDGRIIGAVTHVFVGDPTQGYGIYIDWMLEEMTEIDG